MSLYATLAVHTLFPVHERLKGHSTCSVFRSMDRSQWLSRGDLYRLQLKRLQRFLSLVGQNVPYYRELFQTIDFDPVKVSSIEDLRRLPLMGKPEIRAHVDELKSGIARSLDRFNTGGSSGEPLIFYLGKERVSHDVAAKRRATRWWGVDIGDKEIVVWGSPIELGAQDRIRAIRDRLFRTELVSAFDLSDTRIDEIIARILQRKPRMLFGYPSAIALIAERARATDTVLGNTGLKVVFVTSELLYDHQRAIIEATFGCPVANGYGGRDAGFIAHECPEGSMHITAEDIIVEILDENGDPLPEGECGEIVVTHMATSEFPFIRYRTGDVGSLHSSSCVCGRSLPLLKDLKGRTTDFLIASNGSSVHALALIYVLRDLPGIETFKVTQQTQESVLVEIVKGLQFEKENEEKITEVFKHRLGQDVDIVIRYPDRILPERSGKFRYVVSNVSR